MVSLEDNELFLNGKDIYSDVNMCCIHLSIHIYLSLISFINMQENGKGKSYLANLAIDF